MITASNFKFETIRDQFGTKIGAHLKLSSQLRCEPERPDFDPLLAKEAVAKELMHLLYGDLRVDLCNLIHEINVTVRDSMEHALLVKQVEAILGKLKAAQEVPNETAPNQTPPPTVTPELADVLRNEIWIQSLPPPEFNWAQAEEQIRQQAIRYQPEGLVDSLLTPITPRV